MSPCVLCRGCLRLPTNCPSTSCPTHRHSVRCWILAELNWTGHGSTTTYVFKYSGVCLLVVHVCRTADRVVGHSRPSLPGIGCPCRDPRMCLDVLGGIQEKRHPVFVWLLECGLVSVSWWSKQGQRDCPLLLSYVFRV